MASAFVAQAVPPEQILFEDRFASLDNWVPELEKPGTVTAHNGVLTIDIPAGGTLWFKPELSGSVRIEYTATMISAGGPNDRVSDLNCFWMATDPRSPDDFFAAHRSGKFADYNQLRAYYVGQGGNTNSTTRFRRYIGDPVLRPLLPQHDLKDPSVLLTPNVPYRIRLLAQGNTIRYSANGRLIFDFHDPEPYTRGRFGFRTTFSHVELRNFRVYRPRVGHASAVK
ncbi:MAG TPA: DUF6250 domain-containing protein [Bryobacteraceae bacterium]|nr:DUF6250 domain-containing protein [Bryobacteraceae bacterium]